MNGLKRCATCVKSFDCSIGGWNIRDRDLFDEESGVTANPIESLNAVFKRWLAWKEVSLDALAQMFFLVNGFYVNEIKRGLCGMGTYESTEQLEPDSCDVCRPFQRWLSPAIVV